MKFLKDIDNYLDNNIPKTYMGIKLTTVVLLLIIFYIPAVIIYALFVLFKVLFPTQKEKDELKYWPTPREIYLRTGIKVNGYNGYAND